MRKDEERWARWPKILPRVAPTLPERKEPTTSAAHAAIYQ